MTNNARFYSLHVFNKGTLIKHQHTVGKAEVTIINADATAGVLNNKSLEDFACEVTKELRKVFRKI